jgi:cobalt-precorrin 5A hydrolase
MTRIFFTHSGKQKKADKAGNYVNKAAIFAFTENSKKLASKLSEGLRNYYTYGGKANCKNCSGNAHYSDYEKRYKRDNKIFNSLNASDIGIGTFEFFNYDNDNYRENIERAFNEYDFLIFFLSLGAVIRLISPLITSKLSDPGIIVIDEKGNYVISALSGHIGRANELCISIAEIIDAVPVITTATDISEKFSLDMFAKKFNLNIENKNCIKFINKSSLSAQKIIIFIPESDLIMSRNEDFKNKIKDYFADFNQPVQFIYKKNDIEEILKEHCNELNYNKSNNDESYGNKSTNLNIIVISYKTDVLNLKMQDFTMPDFTFNGLFSGSLNDSLLSKLRYYNITICRLFPRNLSIGIGCNKNTAFEEIENFIQEIFNQNSLSMLSIRNIATIDIKSEEKGILEFARQYAQYIDFFSKDEINNFLYKYQMDLRTDNYYNYIKPDETAGASACFRYTGAYSVCEPCALLSSYINKELLICKKKKMNTTMAVAI